MSSDGTCRFWDVRSKTCVATVQLGGEGLTIAWAADGSVVMVGRKVWTFHFFSIHPPSHFFHPTDQTKSDP